MRKSEVKDPSELNVDYQKAYAIPNKRQARARIKQLENLIEFQSEVVEIQRNLPADDKQKQLDKQRLADLTFELLAIKNTEYDC